MKLKLVDKDQLSFSFWKGYILFEYFELEINQGLHNKNLQDVFNELKKECFGKQVAGTLDSHDSNSSVYGIYDLNQIEFAHFKLISREEFTKSVIDYVISNYKSEMGKNELEMLRLEEIIKTHFHLIHTSFKIILAYKDDLPKLKFPMRYDFFKSYLLLSEDFRQYLHVEIAYD